MSYIEIKDCKPGFILKGINNHKVVNGIVGHFMIFYEAIDEHDFYGAMITSKMLYDNVCMNKEHFELKFKNGKECSVTYKNSHLVNAKLIKNEEMGPFELVGELTDKGFAFVSKVIKELEAISWDQYLYLKSLEKESEKKV
jgi:hypothetical protein